MLGTSHYVRHTTNIHTNLSILIFEEPNRKHILLSRLLSLINIILCYQMLGNFHSPSTAPCLQHCSILFVFTVNRLIQNGKHTHKKKQHHHVCDSKYLFNACIYTREIDIDGYAKEISSTGSARIESIAKLKTKKGRLLNLNHNLFALKIRQNGNTNATNKGIHIRSHHIHHAHTDKDVNKKKAS